MTTKKKTKLFCTCVDFKDLVDCFADIFWL
jgi:hypothetical protein